MSAVKDRLHIASVVVVFVLALSGVANAASTITSTSPSSPMEGTNGFEWDVYGTGFLDGSTVQWNGTDRVTTFVSDTLIQAAILAADVATAGTASLTVKNPDGSISNAVTVTIRPLRPPGVFTVASTAPDGTPANAPSFTTTGGKSASTDARFVAFVSLANNLVPGFPQTNNAFISDICYSSGVPVPGCTPSTTPVVADDGTPMINPLPPFNGQPYAMNRNANFVAFESPAANGASDNPNGKEHVFLRGTCLQPVDPLTCTPFTLRISVAADGTQGDGDSWGPSIAAAGDYVVFNTRAPNLIGPGAQPFVAHVVAYKTCLNQPADCIPGLMLVDKGTGGGPANNASVDPFLSEDGSSLVFTSFASDLVTPATSFGRAHVYLADNPFFTPVFHPQLVSRLTDGTPADGNSVRPTLVMEGGKNGKIYFASDARNLDPTRCSNDPPPPLFTGPGFKVVVVDGSWRDVMCNPLSTTGTGLDKPVDQLLPAPIDGNVFANTSAMNMIPGTGNGQAQVYVYGVDGVRRLISRDASGIFANPSAGVGASTSGWAAVFTSAGNSTSGIEQVQVANIGLPRATKRKVITSVLPFQRLTGWNFLIKGQGFDEGDKVLANGVAIQNFPAFETITFSQAPINSFSLGDVVNFQVFGADGTTSNTATVTLQ